MKKYILTSLILSAMVVSASAADWWRQFDSPILDSLEIAALRANADLRIAQRRVSIAHQAVQSAKAAYYPRIGVSFGWDKKRSADGIWDLGAQASWDLDVFGRTTRSVRHARTLENVAAWEQKASVLSVEAAVATTYFQLQTLMTQLQLTRAEVASQQRIADMVKVRYDANLASRLDLAQADAVLAQTRASIPQLEASLSQTAAALCVLIGETPGREFEADSLLTFRLVPDSVATDQLRRRPDMMEAEAQIHAAAQAVGIARSEYLPSLTLTGSVGVGNSQIKKMFRNESFTYEVTPTLSWTLFDGLSRHAAVVSAREQMEVCLESYNLALLTAIEEAHNAMVSAQKATERADLLAIVVADYQTALDKSVELYKLELTDFTTVATAQISLLESRLALAGAMGARSQASVSYFKAIGAD